VGNYKEPSRASKKKKLGRKGVKNTTYRLDPEERGGIGFLLSEAKNRATNKYPDYNSNGLHEEAIRWELLIWAGATGSTS